MQKESRGQTRAGEEAVGGVRARGIHRDMIVIRVGAHDTSGVGVLTYHASRVWSGDEHQASSSGKIPNLPQGPKIPNVGSRQQAPSTSCVLFACSETLCFGTLR